MSLQAIIDKLNASAPDFSSLGGSIKFSIDGLGDIVADASGIRESSGEADCTILMAADDFNDMLSGALNPAMAFMQGKVKVEGDMSMAMKLQNLLG